MLGTPSGQRGLWEADQLYLDMVGRETYYGVLASLRGRLFCDADSAALYCLDHGRASVPPSLLETADFDLRWKVALGIEIAERPFAKSTLQLCLAQLILRGCSSRACGWPLTRVFLRRKLAGASRSVGPPRAWQGQARRRRLPAVS